MTTTNQDFEKTEEELLLKLADELIAAGEIRFSGPITKKGKIERASTWFENVLRQVKASICFDPKVIAFLSGKNRQNQIDIAAVVIDCLTAAKICIPLGTLSVLIVKGRLENLCS